MNLYELSSNYKQLMDMVDNEEIDVEVLSDTLESIEDGIEEKFENIAKLLKYLDGQIEMFKKEEDRLKTRRLSMENKTKWLKNYLLQSLEITNKDSVQAHTFKIRKQKNPTSVVITDQSKIPLKYMIPQEPKVDKKTIGTLIKGGEKIDGVEIAPISYHVRIQ